MHRLLIVTHEHIGDRMAGPGIRAWEIARSVAGHGFPVTLATPYPGNRRAEGVRLVGFSWDDPLSIKKWLDEADVLMATGPVLSRILHILGEPIHIPTIVDLYYVSEIETVILSESMFPFLTNLLIEETIAYLSQGDFFICATERQQDFWLGVLWMAGRLNKATLLRSPDEWIARVPMGIPEEPPQTEGPVLKGVLPGIAPEDRVVLWMGGLWEWMDPLTLAIAWERVLARDSRARLVFGALQHYDPQVVPPMSRAQRFLERCRESGWIGSSVFFLDWVPYDRRGAYLLEADVGISLHLRSLESRYAIRSRSLDYLWASLPCVLSAGDELADLLGACGLATVVPPEDPEAVGDAILRWLHEAPPRQQLAERTRSLRDSLRWSVVVRPIVEFLQRPRRAPDADLARQRIPQLVQLRHEIDILRAENAQLRAENTRLCAENAQLRAENIRLTDYLSRVRSGRIVRGLNVIYRIFGRRFL